MTHIDVDPPTLGYFRDVNRVRALWAYCEACQSSTTVPIGIFIEHLGLDATIFEVRSKLVCKTCGSRHVFARPEWPLQSGQPHTYPGVVPHSVRTKSEA